MGRDRRRHYGRDRGRETKRETRGDGQKEIDRVID